MGMWPADDYFGYRYQYSTEFVTVMKELWETGRDVGSYVLMMVITGETDEEAMAKWHDYHDNADMDALAWMAGQGAGDPNADASGGTAASITAPEGAVNFNMGTLVGSYGSVARMLDEAAEVPGTKGIMLTFDDFVQGIEYFGTKIQPLMKSRAGKGPAA